IGAQAGLTVYTLTVGSHTIVATYVGDSTFAGSSGQMTQTVNSATGSATTTTLTSSPDPSNFGQMVTFNVTVSPSAGPGAPTGTASFYDGATLLGTGPLSPGGSGAQATFSISTLSVGSHTITASYGGDGNFAGSSGHVSQTVTAIATTTTLTSSLNPSYQWQ